MIFKANQQKSQEMSTATDMTTLWMSKRGGKWYTRNNSWFGLTGRVWFWIIRFPVKVYNELFGCSHRISPASSENN